MVVPGFMGRNIVEKIWYYAVWEGKKKGGLKNVFRSVFQKKIGQTYKPAVPVGVEKKIMENLS